MRYILWSGGLDSTYLLCKLARESDEPIQPIYVLFPETVNRGAADKEIEAQDNLLPFIRSEHGIRAEILKPIRIKEDDLPYREGFEEAYDRQQNEPLVAKHYMYRALGKLTDKYPGIMIGIEAPPPGRFANGIGRTETALNEYGIHIQDDGTLTLDENGNKDMFTIFGGLKFCIAHTNAIEELEALKKWGYEDLIPLMRTCCTALPQQCGVCSNCEIKMLYGDTFKTIMPRAYVNYQIKQYLKSVDEQYANYFTLFVWGQYHLPTGSITTNASGTSHKIFLSNEKAGKLEGWFNALLDSYPNFDKVDRAKYGIE